MFTIVACVCTYQDKVLLLERLPHKSQGSKWGLPAGKPETDEAYEDAMLRELEEETGIVSQAFDLREQGSFEFNKGLSGEYRIILYSQVFSTAPSVQLSPDEHTSYQWLSLEDCLELPNLIADTADLLRAGRPLKIL